jgi:hypothetical protein
MSTRSPGTPMYSGQLDRARVPGVFQTSRTEMDPIISWPSKTPVAEVDDDYFITKESIPPQMTPNYLGFEHEL